MLNVVVNFVDVQDGIRMEKKFAGEDVFKRRISYIHVNLKIFKNFYFNFKS